MATRLLGSSFCFLLACSTLCKYWLATLCKRLQLSWEVGYTVLLNDDGSNLTLFTLFSNLPSKQDHDMYIRDWSGTKVFYALSLKFLIVLSSTWSHKKYCTWASIAQKYLHSRTCYDKIVCAVRFSSRWWVYWYELFIVLRTLWKWQISTKN